ncbi:metal ABC transporter ATP-binding protein [Armatimonas sp.]|uniref:metal ABC transporter ATP-binding protein n=1 Tax=Armatimonas sp. TaxID=1872638 RepID=UPI00286C7CED|nr:metal ABC transporter ATP-binding protein [Armatimonas sp.]
MENTPLITFDDATLGYGRRVVLPSLSFGLSEGGYLGIVGPNGAGKTTLLKAILGILAPLSGKAIHHRKLTFGYVPQAQTTDDLFPITVQEIVVMGRYRRVGLLKNPGSEDRQRAESALEQVGLPHLSTRLFRELSGGQKQRVLMARALVSEPDVLVLDEPTSAMDIAAESATMELIERIHQQSLLLVVLVSHSLNIVANHARTVAILGGTHFQIGPVEKIVQPETLRELFNYDFKILEVDGRRLVL